MPLRRWIQHLLRRVCSFTAQDRSKHTQYLLHEIITDSQRIPENPLKSISKKVINLTPSSSSFGKFHTKITPMNSINPKSSSCTEHYDKIKPINFQSLKHSKNIFNPFPIVNLSINRLLIVLRYAFKYQKRVL